VKEDTKQPNNVIRGPWSLTETLKKKAADSQKDWAAKEKMAADFVFTEQLTEAICVKMLTSLTDNRVKVDAPEFQKYLPFFNEVIKSYIMYTKGYSHPLQEFVNKIMIESTLDKGAEINYNVLDIKTIKKILKDIYGKK
tara:strand:- start:20 stop:436 length:417 start_codon:yes stop_codon:yes gene_type:complete